MSFWQHIGQTTLPDPSPFDDHINRVTRLNQAALEMQERFRQEEEERIEELTNSADAKYLILQGENPAVLQDKVNRILSLGWELAGGVQRDNNSYIQSMYKPKREEQTVDHFDNTDLFNV